MRWALLLLVVLQEGAPTAQDRERIRSKAPLTPAQKAAYRAPVGPALKPRAFYTLAVVPLEFSDRAPAGVDLEKLFFGGLAGYYSKASGGQFTLKGQVGRRVVLGMECGKFERKDLEKALGGLPPCDGVAFVAPGGLAPRGSALWPHRSSLRSGDREIDYLLVPEEASVAIIAHEFMHLLGFAYKYDDEKSSVADACILGTGYSIQNPPPPCAECRAKLGWTSPSSVDPAQASSIVLAADTTRAVKIPLTAEADETLLLEMRDRLLIWHVGGGKKIELLGRFPSESGDRLTPFSQPSFRGRSLGARVVWITDIRVEDGQAWFQVAPEAPFTPLEEWRRSHVGKRLGD